MNIPTREASSLAVNGTRFKHTELSTRHWEDALDTSESAIVVSCFVCVCVVYMNVGF